ncbi:hypothetical protein HDU77_006131 [Chytriomyces hyalinus]|nr:hypothetical protein HDU77_006131 [Chytriomyces hyalinus]
MSAIPSNEFERWIATLYANKETPQKAAATIISDPRLFPHFPTTQDPDQKQPEQGQPLLTINTLAVSSVDVKFKVKQLLTDQFKVLLRHPSPLLYEALWLLMAALTACRKLDTCPGEFDSNAAEVTAKHNCILQRSKSLQEAKLLEVAVSIMLDGFAPSFKIEPRRAAMLYVSGLAEHSAPTLMTSFPKILPFLRETLTDEEADPVLWTLAVRTVSFIVEDENTRHTLLNAGLFQDVLFLLDQTCKPLFHDTRIAPYEGSSFFLLISTIRIEILALLCKLIRSELFRENSEWVREIAENDNFVWILGHSEFAEELATTMQAMRFLMRKRIIGFTMCKRMIPALLEHMTSDEATELVRYQSLKTIRCCLNVFTGSIIWPVMHSASPCVLTDLADILQTSGDAFIQETLAIFRDLTHSFDDTGGGGAETLGKRRATLGGIAKRVGAVSRPRSSSIRRSPSISPRTLQRKSIVPGSPMFQKLRAPDPRAILVSLCMPRITLLLEQRSQWPKAVIHQALCVVCNLAVVDTISQQLSNQKELIRTLFRICQESRPKNSNTRHKFQSATSSRIFSSAVMLYSVKRPAPAAKSSHDVRAFDSKENVHASSAHSLHNQHHETTPYMNAKILLDALSCIRNLCIDLRACTEIMEIGSPTLLKILTETAAHTQLHRVTLSILRNILLQDTSCIQRLISGLDNDDCDSDTPLFNDTGFIEEVVVALSASNEREAQQCAVEIVDALVKHGGDAVKHALLDAGCLSALLVPMNDAMAVEGVCEMAAGSFTLLQELLNSVMETRVDVWSRLRADWDAQDAAKVVRKSVVKREGKGKEAPVKKKKEMKGQKKRVVL